MARNRLALVAVIVIAVCLFFILDAGQYLNLEYLKSRQADLDALRAANPWQSALVFFLIYIAVTGLSLPGAVPLTLIGAAIFGLLWGTIIVSFASSIGATLAFLVSRYLLKENIQNRFADKLAPINAGIEKDGALYLFMLRLVPVFPFFIINLVMGLTPMKTWTFYWVSQAGMLAGTLVFVNAGTQIASIETLSGILSPGLLASFALLGVFPLIARKAVSIIKDRKVLSAYDRPSHFDRDIIAIGAGSAGLVTAYIGAAVKARVSLIEKNRMGGDCLNTGCVPSKALIRSARFLADAARAEQLGFNSVQVDFDFAKIMQRVQRIIKTVEPHDSVERYSSLGVDCIQGAAKIVSPWSVAVNDKIITTRNIVVATGGRPTVPAIPGIETTGYWTSDTVWDMRQLPKRLLVLGGGPIGCELAQCFARFGAEVTIVQRGPRLLKKEDPEFSRMLMDRFREEKIDLKMAHKPKEFLQQNGRKILLCEHGDEAVEIEFDGLLVAVGRTANTRKLGLEELGITLTDKGTVEVNEYLQTRFPNIYAVGDVASPYQFTHTAAHEAWYAAVNALFGRFKKFKVDYSVIPWATFTDPEIARVGLNEQEACQQGIDFEVTTYAIDDLDRAIADEAAEGAVKVLTVPGKDRILGVTIAGEHAGDLIAEYVTAMRHKLGMNKILGTIHIYPTLTEANKFAAGEWKKAHAPEKLLKWVERLHAWQRGDRHR